MLKRKIEELTLDMKAGLIPVKFSYSGEEPDILWMKQLPPVFGDIHPVEKFTEFLGLSLEDFDNNFPIQEVSTGIYFYIIPLKTKEALKRVKVDSDKLAEYSKDRSARWPFMFCREPENP